MLSSLTVVEVEGTLAGGWAARLLADWGAHVVKLRRADVEQDLTDRERAIRDYVDSGKEVQDLPQTVLLDALRKHSEAGILVWSGEKQTGLTPAAIQAIRPDAILVSVTPWGLTGPWKDWATDEYVSQHAGGVAYYNGWRAPDPNTYPPLTIPGGAVAEYLGGAMASTLALAEYFAPQRSGKVLDVSTLEALASNVRWDISYMSYVGQAPTRAVDGRPRALTWLQPVQDGLADVFVRDDQQWDILVELWGRPESLQSELFASHASRTEYWDALLFELEAIHCPLTREEFAERAQARGVLVAPVLTIPELLGDEHVRYRDALVPHPTLPEITVPGPPIRRPDPALRTLSVQPAATSAAAGIGPLNGVRVIDFTVGQSGPYAARLLADLGADVIKVESISGTPDHRDAGPKPPGLELGSPNVSGLWNTLNAGKRSVTVDFLEESHRDAVKRLIAESDAVIENFRPGVLASHGLDYGSLAAVRPGLVMVSLSAFGQTGPRSRYRGLYCTVQAACGLTALNAYPGERPRTIGGAWADYVSGAFSTWATVAALVSRKQSGLGAHIDVAMSEVMTASIASAFIDFGLTGEIPTPTGNSRAGEAMTDVVKCKGEDAWIAASFPTTESEQALCRLLREDEPDAEGSLKERLSAWARRRTVWEASARLQSAGIASAPSCSPRELVCHPQLRSRSFFVRENHPELGNREHAGNPFGMTPWPRPAELRAPLYGEHNSSILAGILDVQEISRIEDRLKEVRPRR